MKKSAFKLRSGNSSAYKMMGSSPVKQLSMIPKAIKMAKDVGKGIKKLFTTTKKSTKTPSKWKGHYKVRTPDKHGKGYIDIMSDFPKKGGKPTGYVPYKINPKTMKAEHDFTKRTHGQDAFDFGGAIIKEINK